MRDVTQTPPAIKVTQQQLECVKCGAQTAAVCSCGMSYRPAAIRVAEYDKANPGKSTRTAAADLGVSHETVSQARKSGVNHLTPETVTGRDGKEYPAIRPSRDGAKRAEARCTAQWKAFTAQEERNAVSNIEPPKPTSPPQTQVMVDHKLTTKLGNELIDAGYKALSDQFNYDQPTLARLKQVRDDLRSHVNAIEWF